MKDRLAKHFAFVFFLLYGLRELYFFAGSFEFPDLLRFLLYLVVALSFLKQMASLRADTGFRPTFIAFSHLLMPLFFRREDGAGLYFGELLSVAGLLFSTVGAIELWESFAVLPALRRIKTAGAYKITRHPIYSGYLLTAVGVCLSNQSFYNLTVLVVFGVLTIFRVKMEENILAGDDGYKQYSNVVKYRLVPCVY